MISSMQKWLITLGVIFLYASYSFADCLLINAAQEKFDKLTVQEWSLNGTFSATQADGKLMVIPARSVFVVRQSATSSPLQTNPDALWRLLLRNGDIIIGRPIGIQGNSLNYDAPGLGKIEIPLKSASLLTAYSDSADAQLLLTQPASAARDLLRLKNGDKLEGLVADIGESKIQIQSDLGLTSVDLAQVDRLVFAGVPVPATDQLQARIRISNGTTLTSPSLNWSLSKLTFKDPAGHDVACPAEIIRGIDMLNGNACSLTDFVPTENIHHPYLGPLRLARMNTNVTGKPLTVAGVVYDYGIGMQTKGRLVYEINRAFTKFSFIVAMDDSAASLGRANISVWADGKEIYSRFKLAPGLQPQTIILNISNVNILELRADFDSYQDVLARVDWLNPVLHRP